MEIFNENYLQLQQYFSAARSTQTLELSPAKEAQYDRVQHFFVSGLLKQEIDAAKICNGADM